MIFSKESLFSDDQAVVATAPSTNVIDLGAPGTPARAAAAIIRDIARGNPVPIAVLVTEAFNTMTSLTVTIETDDDEAFGSPTVVATSGAIVTANLIPGYLFPWFSLPPGIFERYLRLVYTVAGTPPTTGKITAGVVAALQTNLTVPGGA